MIRSKTAIVGVGYTPGYRHTDETIGTLVLRAARDAILDAGLTAKDIDAIASRVRPLATNIPTPTDGIDHVSTMFMQDGLGLDTLSWSVGIHEGANQLAAFADAVHAVALGICKYALLYTQVYRPKEVKYHRREHMTSHGPDQFMRPYGWGVPMQRTGMWMNRCMYESSLREEHMAYVVLNDRRWAQTNPLAIFRDPLTMEEYMASRPIVPPIKLFDCDMPVDTAHAWVITSAERARDLRQKPAYIAAAQVGLPPHCGDHDSGGIFSFDTYTDTAHDYTMRTLWDNAGISRDDIDVAGLYDGFSPLALYWLKALGYGSLDEVGPIMKDIYEGRRKPLVNTNGGMLSMGRSHGAAFVTEAVLQLQGRAGERQAPDVRATLATMGGHMQDSGALVLTSEPV